jgi:hypothetical protein
MSVFSTNGHGHLLARPHATNRLGPRHAEVYLNGDLQQLGESTRPPTPTVGAHSPVRGPGSPSFANDDVWAVDLAPLALGAGVDSSPGPGEAPYSVEPNGTLCGDGKGGLRSIEAQVRAQR